MTVEESIKNAVSNGDIKSIRIMMKNSLLVDPTFAEFDEMEKLARNVKGLYDPHDGREFQLDKAHWNDDYMNKLMVQVVNNFSHERIEHLKEVVRYLHPVTSTGQKTSLSNGTDHAKRRTSGSHQQIQHRSYQEQKRCDQLNGTYRGAKIAGGAAVGAAAGAVVAAAASTAVVAGAVIGAAAGAAVAMVVTNGAK
ncbi:MAG: Gly-zipper-Omp domain-containing protein [Clostridium sp.]|jgi:hypothetical protein